MNLPIGLSEPRHAWRSSKVALSWSGSFAGQALKIKVGLSRSDAQEIADLAGQLLGGETVYSTLHGEGRTGLPLKPPPGHADSWQIPQVIPRVSGQQAQVSSGDPKPPRVSGNENAAVVNFWNSLSWEEQQAFRTMADKRVFAAGARLMEEGEQANHVAVILDGLTEIRVLKNGHERVVARRGPGQLIGERAALRISVRSATVVAIQPVDALVMHTDRFVAFISDHPGVLDIVENQIFTRMKEEPAGCENDQPRGALATSADNWSVPDRSGHHSFPESPRPHRRVLNGENCTVLLTDVVSFGADERNDEDREIIRQATSDMTRLALDPAWDVCRCEGRGDGHLVVAPPSIPTAQVMEWLLTVLPRELKRHNRIYSKYVRIQLRVALDVGPIVEDAEGVSGKSIIQAARMIDAPAFKQAIADADANLGIIASPFVYDTAIKPGRGSLDPTTYTEVPVLVKEARTSGWMQLIGPARTVSLSRGQLTHWSKALHGQHVLAMARSAA
jgi:cyclic nucleotide-binding protein